MAKQLKRKGLGFVTEHYVDSKVIDIIVNLVAKQLNDSAFDGYVLRRLCDEREISVWADPMGLAFYVGHGRMPSPIPWADLNVSSEDRNAILVEMCDAFTQNYQRTDKKPKSFRIICNDEKIQMLLDIMEI